MTEFITTNAGVLISTIITLVVGGIGYGMLKQAVKDQGIRLASMEKLMESMQSILIKVAVQDERLAAMDQRSILQGQRIDANNSQFTEIARTLTARMDDLSRRVDANAILIRRNRPGVQSDG